MKLSADPHNPIFLFLNEFFHIDHVLTSKKKSVGMRDPTQGLSHSCTSSGNGMFL
jgi:hypothetical protein